MVEVEEVRAFTPDGTGVIIAPSLAEAQEIYVTETSFPLEHSEWEEVPLTTLLALEEEPVTLLQYVLDHKLRSGDYLVELLG